jgi:hypothetical protein
LSIRAASTIKSIVKAAVSSVIVAIAIPSWFALLNHCAITALAAKPTHEGCPFHSKPAKPAKSTECCKILRAIPSAPAKELAPAIIDLAPIDSTSRRLAILEPPQISFTPSELDIGPPGKTSFAELNRSLRAHAPPFLV